MTLHGILSYQAPDIALIILHSRESRMVVGYGAALCSLLTFWLVGYIHTDKQVR